MKPTDVEVHDIINRLDDGSDTIIVEEFFKEMVRKNKEVDQETYYKESFRIFYKDKNGCIHAEELNFVLRNPTVS